MNGSTIRILVVDDFEPWRRATCAMLSKEAELKVIGEASDGLDAVQQAERLQPDLILLDIGLPALNGIEAARRIREVSPTCKILFVSDNRSADIAEEALNTGACGYVVKSEAGSELLLAVRAVLAGKRFLSASLPGPRFSAPTIGLAAAIPHSHDVAFYADDSSLVDGYALFIESALRDGNVVIVVLTESHRANLLPKLKANGVDVSGEMEEGQYIALDAADTLSRLVDNDGPDPVRCAKVVGDLIIGAAKKLKGPNVRVVVCGETAPTLLSRGNAEGAIMLEHLWDQIARNYGIQVLCGYLSSAFAHPEADPVFQRICAEHSATYGLENRI